MADVDPLAFDPDDELGGPLGFFAALLAGEETVTLADLLGRPEWHRRAACRGLGVELFFIPRGGDSGPAKAICSTCEVVAQCADAGRSVDHGIWAGTSAQRLRPIRSSSAPGA